MDKLKFSLKRSKTLSPPKDEEPSSSTEPTASTSRSSFAKKIKSFTRSSKSEEFDFTVSQNEIRDYKIYDFTKDKVITIKGRIRETTHANEPYACFFGMPYAKPPINELRFMPPEPALDLIDNYDASSEKNICMQTTEPGSLQIIGKEDCLYLNVYVPKDPANVENPLPVMVYFHGGGFTNGNGNISIYGPDHLINYGVLVITVTFRLHIFGFLNLEIPECPGNFGLKDQTMALRWIQQNVRSFGGDEKNVTIFGNSAGASAVNFHMVSPLSRNLFHKGILQSGTVYCPWGLANNTIELARRVYKKFFIMSDDPHTILTLFKTLKDEDLVKHAFETIYELKTKPFNVYSEFFGPVIECKAEGAFLPTNIEELMTIAEPVPIILGINKFEGLLTFRAMGSYNFKHGKESTFEEILGQCFNVTDPKRLASVSNRVKKCYHSIKHSKVKQFVNLLTDSFFYRFYDSFEFIVDSECPAFVYKFVFHGKYNIFMRSQPTPEFTFEGAGHSDELGYLFSQNLQLKQLYYGAEEKRMTEILCQLWTSFAHKGIPHCDMYPSVLWKPQRMSKSYYLKIGKSLKLEKQKLNGDRFDFLKKIVDILQQE